MDQKLPPPTPYPEINAVLSQLFAGVRSVLGRRLVGLYLGGSLAAGDFNPRRSDIDFLSVTEGSLPSEFISTLRAMHARLSASGLAWAGRLEGSYIPRDALRRYDPARARHPALRVDGSFDIDQHGPDWVILAYIFRQHGIPLAGPPLPELIDPVSADDLRRASRGILEEWWAPQLIDSHRLLSGEYRAYAVLTMGRILYTLQQGEVVSKPAAARWAQAALGGRFAALIQRALAWPSDPLENTLAETLAFIQDTLVHSRQDKGGKPGGMEKLFKEGE